MDIIKQNVQKNRLLKDFLDLKRNPLPLIEVEPEGDDLSSLHCNIGGTINNTHIIAHVTLEDFEFDSFQANPRTKICGKPLYMVLCPQYDIVMQEDYFIECSLSSWLLTLQHSLFNEPMLQQYLKTHSAGYKCPKCDHDMKNGVIHPSNQDLEQLVVPKSVKEEDSAVMTLQRAAVPRRKKQNPKGVRMATSVASTSSESLMRLPTHVLVHHVMKYLNEDVLVSLCKASKDWCKLVLLYNKLYSVPQELTCYISRATSQETCIGMGVHVLYTVNGSPPEIIVTHLGNISLDAYMSESRALRSLNGETYFDSWIPQFISTANAEQHFLLFKLAVLRIEEDRVKAKEDAVELYKRALRRAKRRKARNGKASTSSDEREMDFQFHHNFYVYNSWNYHQIQEFDIRQMNEAEFEPVGAVKLLLKLMHCLVASIASGQRAPSVLLLTQYYQLYLWLVYLQRLYPQVAEYIEARVEAFITSVSQQRPTEEMVLGQALTLLHVSKKHSWSSAKQLLIQNELFARLVPGVIAKYPQMAGSKHPAERRSMFFRVGSNTLKAFIFYNLFPSFIARHNGELSQPSELLMLVFQQKLKHALKIQNLEEWFDRLGMPSHIITTKQIDDLLLNNMVYAAQKKYYTPTPTKLDSNASAWKSQ